MVSGTRRARSIARATEWNRTHKERRKEIKDKWRENNRERTNFLTRRYIYRRKNAIGGMTLEEQRYVYKMMPLCPYCNLNKSDTLDHVTPLSKGGTNNADNVIAVCRSCNSKKGAKTLLEFNPILYMMWNNLSHA